MKGHWPPHWRLSHCNNDNLGNPMPLIHVYLIINTGNMYLPRAIYSIQLYETPQRLVTLWKEIINIYVANRKESWPGINMPVVCWRTIAILASYSSTWWDDTVMTHIERHIRRWCSLKQEGAWRRAGRHQGQQSRAQQHGISHAIA